MSISPDATRKLEAHRQDDGKFGAQPKTEAVGITLDPSARACFGCTHFHDEAQSGHCWEVDCLPGCTACGPGKTNTPQADAAEVEAIQEKARRQLELTASAPALLIAHVSDAVRDAIPDAAYIVVDEEDNDDTGLVAVYDDQGSELDWGELNELSVNHELARVSLATWADVAEDRGTLPGDLSDPYAFGEIIALSRESATQNPLDDPVAEAEALRTERIADTTALLSKRIRAAHPDAEWAIVEPDEDDEAAAVTGVYDVEGRLLADDNELVDVASLLTRDEWDGASNIYCPDRVFDDMGQGFAIRLASTKEPRS